MSRSVHAIDTAATAPMDRWDTLPWKQLQRQVLQLQKRIYVRHEKSCTSGRQVKTEEYSSRDALFPVPA
jgi:hypothetical protein